MGSRTGCLLAWGKSRSRWVSRGEEVTSTGRLQDARPALSSFWLSPFRQTDSRQGALGQREDGRPAGRTGRAEGDDAMRASRVCACACARALFADHPGPLSLGRTDGLSKTRSKTEKEGRESGWTSPSKAVGVCCYGCFSLSAPAAPGLYERQAGRAQRGGGASSSPLDWFRPRPTRLACQGR
jgi:hypothetical protein